MSSYRFPAPLLRATIIEKKARFVAMVALHGEVLRCYLPPTVKIGDFHLDGLPCLLQPNPKPGRTSHTVKALSLDGGASWVGVDLGFSNRLVEHFAGAGDLEPLLGAYRVLEREKKLGTSKLDFHVDDLWLEVKTPVDTLHKKYGPGVRLREEDARPLEKVTLKTGELERRQVLNPGRMEAQVKDMLLALEAGERAAVLTVHQYVPEERRPYRQTTKKQTLVETLALAYAAGLESWTLDLEVTPEEVAFRRLSRSTMKR